MVKPAFISTLRTQLSDKLSKITDRVSLRLNKITLEKLLKEADESGVSLNAIVSKALKQYIDWHSNAVKAGFITVRRATVLKLLEKVSEDEIKHIGRYIASSESKDFVLMLRNEYNINSALDVIETWIKISGYPYNHETKYDKHRYFIQHDMGKKWSLYLSEAYAFIFEEFGLEKPRFEIRENSLSFE